MLGIIALLFVLSGVALGHDVQASWTTVRFHPDTFELTVRLHAEAVRTLIQETAPGATFEPENFDKVRPALHTNWDTKPLASGSAFGQGTCCSLTSATASNAPCSSA